MDTRNTAPCGSESLSCSEAEALALLLPFAKQRSVKSQGAPWVELRVRASGTSEHGSEFRLQVQGATMRKE